MAALLLCAALQNATELVRRLGDEDPEVRDAATQKLIELGEAALPALREAPDDPEVRARAARVIDRIEWPAMKALEAELKRLNESGMRKYELVEKSDAEFRRAFPEVRVFHLPVTWQAPVLSSVVLGPTYFIWRMESELVDASEFSTRKSIVIGTAEQATLLARALYEHDEIPEFKACESGFATSWIAEGWSFSVRIDVDSMGRMTKVQSWSRLLND